MPNDCRKMVTVEDSVSEPEVFGKFSGDPRIPRNGVQHCSGSSVHSSEVSINRF